MNFNVLKLNSSRRGVKGKDSQSRAIVARVIPSVGAIPFSFFAKPKVLSFSILRYNIRFPVVAVTAFVVVSLKNTLSWLNLLERTQNDGQCRHASFFDQNQRRRGSLSLSLHLYISNKAIFSMSVAWKTCVMSAFPNG
jgi:hypothetical protein